MVQVLSSSLKGSFEYLHICIFSQIGVMEIIHQLAGWSNPEADKSNVVMIEF